MTATSADVAPINNRQLIHWHDVPYKLDKEVADAALGKMIKHGWYLTQEVVIFALFSTDPRTTNTMKGLMATKLLNTETPDELRTGKLVFQTIAKDTTLVDLTRPE